MKTELIVKIYIPMHYAWDNDDNSRVPKDRADYNAVLYSDDGLCCLGFAGYACGIGSDWMRGVAAPEDCSAWLQDDIFVEALYYADNDAPTFHNTKFVGKCIDLNDANGEYKSMPYKERMERLHELGLKHGVDFQFVWDRLEGDDGAWEDKIQP